MPDISAARARPASKVMISTYDVDGFSFVKKTSVPEKAWILRRREYHRPTESDRTAVHKNMIMLMRIVTHYMPFRTHPNFSTILSQDFGGNQTTICQWISRLINGRKAFSARAGARLSPVTDSETALLLCQVVDDYIQNWTVSVGTIFSESIVHDLRKSWAQMMRKDPEGLLLRGPSNMDVIPAGEKRIASHLITIPDSRPPLNVNIRGRTVAAGSSSSRDSRSRSECDSNKDIPYRQRSPVRHVTSPDTTTNRPTPTPTLRPTSPEGINPTDDVPLNPVSVPRRPMPARVSSSSRGEQPDILPAHHNPPPILNTREPISELSFHNSHPPTSLQNTPRPVTHVYPPAVQVVTSATGAGFSMLWEELQAEMNTQVENSVTARVERAVTEQSAALVAEVAGLRQRVITVQGNRTDDVGPLIQTLKDEFSAKLESVQTKIDKSDEAREPSEELYQQQSKDHQREVRSLKQELESLSACNQNLTKRVEKMEGAFQCMAQLYGQKEPSVDRPQQGSI